MQTRPLAGARSAIIECAGSIVALDDALSIVSASYELNTNRLLLRERQLPAAFFELRTGFAGEFIQKLVNYQIMVACVFGDERLYGERFREYVAEAKRGRQFRSFTIEADAIAWLEEH